MQEIKNGIDRTHHKIFLYKEDFAKFAGGLQEVIDFIRRSKPEFFEQVAEKA